MYYYLLFLLCILICYYYYVLLSGIVVMIRMMVMVRLWYELEPHSLMLLSWTCCDGASAMGRPAPHNYVNLSFTCVSPEFHLHFTPFHLISPSISPCFTLLHLVPLSMFNTFLKIPLNRVSPTVTVFTFISHWFHIVFTLFSPVFTSMSPSFHLFSLDFTIFTSVSPSFHPRVTQSLLYHKFLLSNLDHGSCIGFLQTYLVTASGAVSPLRLNSDMEMEFCKVESVSPQVYNCRRQTLLLPQPQSLPLLLALPFHLSLFSPFSPFSPFHPFHPFTSSPCSPFSHFSK